MVMFLHFSSLKGELRLMWLSYRKVDFASVMVQNNETFIHSGNSVKE